MDPPTHRQYSSSRTACNWAAFHHTPWGPETTPGDPRAGHPTAVLFLVYLREKSVLSLHTGCAEPDTSKVEHFRAASCLWANISKVGSSRCSYKSSVIPIHWPLVEMKQWIRQLLNSDPRKKIMINICLFALTSFFFLYTRQRVLNVMFKENILVLVFLPSIYKAKHHLHQTYVPDLLRHLAIHWACFLSLQWSSGVEIITLPTHKSFEHLTSYDVQSQSSMVQNNLEKVVIIPHISQSFEQRAMK